MDSWSFTSLLRTVLSTIFEVSLLCVAGYVLARRDVLDKKTQKTFNVVNTSLFTPALLFSKVAFSLNPTKLKELWIIPIVFSVTTLTSMLVAYLFGSLMGLRKSQKCFAMAAAMFMNSNSLPVALMQSIIITSSGLLKWGEDDNQNAMIGRALSYLVLYSSMGMILRWSYGVRLLSQADEERPAEPDFENGQPSENTALIHSTSDVNPYHAIETSPKLGLTLYPEFEDNNAPTLIGDGAKVLNKLPGSCSPTRLYPTPSVSPLATPSSQHSPLVEPPPRIQVPESRLLPRVRIFISKFMAFMTMPMWAALLSLIVACIPLLQQGFLRYMAPVKSALNAAGDCSIPLTQIVLGAYFHTPKIEGESTTATNWICKVFHRHERQDDSPDDRNRTPGESKTVLVAVMSRMILTPLVLLPVLTGLLMSRASGVFDDPIFVLTNVLLITSAPALTLAQITQAACGDAFERLISRTIFWAYCVLTPISTIISVLIGLMIIQY